MTWWMILATVVYGIGWLVYIIQSDPSDSLDGAVAIFTGCIWPLFALGWLVSRG